MAKGTLIFLFFLAILATLLFGINLGKKLYKSQSIQVPPTPTITLSPTPTPTIISVNPTAASTPSATFKKILGNATFTNATCGFSFSYPGSFLRQKTVNEQSIIYADPENPSVSIAATCATNIPRPPVSSDKIEAINLDKVAATLYHDQNADGTPRDEVIVKHPTNGQEIIVAGFGEFFRQVLSSFKFN